MDSRARRAVIVRVCAGFRLGAGAGCAQQRRRESESVGAGPHDEARGAMHGMAAHLALLAVDDGLGDVDDPLHLLRRLAPAVPHRGLGVDQLPTRSTTPSLTGSSEHDARQRSAANEDDEAYLAVQHHLEVPGAAAVLVESYTYVLPELHLQRFRQRIRVSVVHSARSSAQLPTARRTRRIWCC